MRICRPLLIYASLILVWGAFHPTVLAAQETQDDEDMSQPLHYADQSTPRNNLVIDLNGATAYDDNVFSDNAHRVGSSVFQGGAHFGLDEEREHSALSIDYLPEFLSYSKVDGYNQVNQNLRFAAKYALSRHLELSLKDSAQYFTGISSPRLNEDLSPETGPPPTLNSTVFVSLARTFSNEGRLDALYQMSRRTSLDFFGSIGTRNFSSIDSPQESLYNTQAYSGGVAYTYRLNSATTVGLSGLHQTLRFGESHDEIDSPLVTFAWEGKSGITASAYGGPQYVRLNDSLILPGVSSGTTVSSFSRESGTTWEGGGGGSVGWRSSRTVVQVSAQRLASDGGGIFTSVMNSSESFDVRRHLFRRWDLLVTAENAQSKALAALYGGAGINDQIGNLKIEWQLANNLVTQIGYEADRQRAIGAFPYLVDMNRNYLSLGFFYRVGRIPIGR